MAAGATPRDLPGGCSQTGRLECGGARLQGDLRAGEMGFAYIAAWLNRSAEIIEVGPLGYRMPRLHRGNSPHNLNTSPATRRQISHGR